MKRLICLVLVLTVVLMLFSLPSSANGEVFVAAGNTVLPLTDSLPIRSSGVWYIDYQCFTQGNLDVSSSYNSSERILVLYTWDTTLIFNLNETTAYTTAEKIKYKAVAFTASGTVYVPVQFTAQMLDLNYTYFSDIPLIRIYRASDIPSNMFQYIAESSVNELRNSQNTPTSPSASPSPSPAPNLPQTPNPTPELSPEDGNTDYPDNKDEKAPSSETGQTSEPLPAPKKNVALTFNITDGKNMSLILDTLAKYNVRATFFIQGSAISNCENELREAVASGHNLGSLSENGSADFNAASEELSSFLNQMNERLFEVTKIKTRLVRVPDSSTILSRDTADTIISLGYRIWDQTVLPIGDTETKLYKSAVSQLVRDRDASVVTIPDSDIAVGMLERLLKYFITNNYDIYTIDILDVPVNQIEETR